MSQIAKKVEGSFKLEHESESIDIDFINGFIVVRNKQLHTLLECTPNKTWNNIPINRYKVTIIVEAMEK